MLKFTTGDWSQNWQPCARVAAEVIADTTRIDACLAEHSPDAGLFLARWYARRFNVAWAADFRDPVLQPLTIWGRRIYRPLVKRLLYGARATVNVTPIWAAQDAEVFGLPAHTITNGFDEEEFARLEAAAPGNETNAETSAADSDEGFLTIAYGGSLYDGLQTFLDGIVALRRVSGDEVFARLRFHYSGVARAEIESAARARGIADIVAAEDQLPRRIALERLRRADVLLLLAGKPQGDAEFYAQGMYPGKTFEYFGLRKPILCVPGDAGGLLDNLLQTTRTGTIARTPSEVAAALGKLSEIKRAGAPLPYVPDETEVARYTRAAGASKLAALLNEISRRPRSGNKSSDQSASRK